MLTLAMSACALDGHMAGKTGGSLAEDAKSDCGTIVMLRPADVREGFSRDLDCGQENIKKDASGRTCFQYTVLLDHGGSFMVAQRQIPSMAVGKRVCIVPGASGYSGVMRAE